MIVIIICVTFIAAIAIICSTIYGLRVYQKRIVFLETKVADIYNIANSEILFIQNVNKNKEYMPESYKTRALTYICKLIENCF